MVTFHCSAADLSADERNVLERVVGTDLSMNQRIVVQVLDAEPAALKPAPRAADYAIFADLEEGEAELICEAIAKRSPSRDTTLLKVLGSPIGVTHRDRL